MQKMHARLFANREEHPRQEPPHPRRWLVATIKMAIAFALLGLVVVLNRQQIQAVMSRHVDAQFFAIGFVLYLAGLILAFVRWSLYVRALDIPFRIRDGLRLGFLANLFNFIVPGGPLGGDVVRAAFLCREQAALKTQAIASVVLDRLVGLLALFLLACGAGTLCWHRLDGPVQRLVVLAWVVSLVVVLILAIGFSPALYHPLTRRFAHRKRLAKRLHELVAAGTLYRSRLGVVVLGLGMAMTTHSLIIISFYFASRALLPNVPSLAEHFLIVPLILVTTAIPLPFGALGLSEGVSAHLFGLAAYPGGAVAMMGFRVVQYASAIVSVCVYMTNRQQARALAETAEHLVDDSGDDLVSETSDGEVTQQRMVRAPSDR